MNPHEIIQDMAKIVYEYQKEFRCCAKCYNSHFSHADILVFEGNCGCNCHEFPRKTKSYGRYGDESTKWGAKT